jgi:hypothetical protein
MDTTIPFLADSWTDTRQAPAPRPTPARASHEPTPIPTLPLTTPERAPFVLSVELEDGCSTLDGFHLGTHAGLARHIAANYYHGRVQHGLPVVTVALLRDGKLFDVYYGNAWQSEQED